jgi:hypothetical protein
MVTSWEGETTQNLKSHDDSTTCTQRVSNNGHHDKEARSDAPGKARQLSCPPKKRYTLFIQS